ncbi:MAG: DHH family phosphoesterase, partial [Clostridia bacterium]|nr:DHH family phosphoesterase [Clostridia bacterium]
PGLIVAVDVADTSLLGKSAEHKYSEKIDLCIDHHASNKLYASAVWLEPDSASAAEMVYNLIKKMELPITKQMASCLFTGVSTDTGCFRFSNTTPRTHRIAADLIELGADSENLIQTFFETKSRAYASLERMALDEMQFYLGGRCAIMPLTRAMFGKSGADDTDTDRLANLPRQVEGVLVGVTLKEQSDGSFKASLRTHGDVDASAICGRLGGGGHKGAAGVTLKVSMAQCISRLVDEIEKEIGD